MPSSSPPKKDSKPNGTTSAPSSNSTSNISSHDRLRPSDREDLAAIDATIERMRGFTRLTPYILTIPQEDEAKYRYTWQFQATQWLDHTPFDGRDEHPSIQYQTFVYHEPGTDVFMQKNLEMEETIAQPSGKVGTPLPGTAQPKKKISFGTYKKKQAGEVVSGDDEVAVKEQVKSQQPDAKKAMAVKSPAETVKADKEVLDAVQEMEAADKPKSIAQRLEQGDKGGKRKREDEGAVKEESHARESDGSRAQKTTEAEPPATKKARKSPPPPAEKHSIRSAREKRDTPAERTSDPPVEQHIQKPSSQLPVTSPKQSPTPEPEGEDEDLPPRLSPLHNSDLPPRLSPTLPDNIMATMKARAEFHTTSTPNGITKDDMLTPTRKTDAITKDDLLTPTRKSDAITKHKSPIPRNGFRANSSSPAVRSDAEDRAARRVISKQGNRHLTPDRSPEEVITVTRKKKNTETFEMNGGSLMVTLKFSGNGLRDFVARHKSPTKSGLPSNKASDLRQREKRDLNAKGVAQKVAPTSAAKQRDAKSSGPDKRSRATDDDESEPAPKRMKPPPAATEDAESNAKKKKAPMTPVQKEEQPSSLPGSSHHKATPGLRKDTFSGMMGRQLSNSSTKTPSGQAGSPTAGTAQMNSTTAAATSHPKSASANRPFPSQTPLQQAWDSEQKRLEALGRELKHAATGHHGAAIGSSSNNHSRHTSSPTPPSSSTANNNNNSNLSTSNSQHHQKKLAALSSLESLLAYILAFTASDESARAADPPLAPSSRYWRDLIPYFGFVKKHCEAFPQLQLLAYTLGVALSARVLDLAARHPSSNSGSADHSSTSTSSSSTVPREALLETFQLLIRCASEVEAKLDLETLQELFPETWRGRQKGGSSSTASNEKLKPTGDWYSGTYRLPLGIATPPFRAARAVAGMLREWVGREGGEYEFRLKF